MTKIDPLFMLPKLNEKGKMKSDFIEYTFTTALLSLEGAFPLGGREGAIVRSKLEEACYFAKKCLAQQRRWQAE